MNDLIKAGKKRTILVSVSVLLISIYTIYLYHSVRPEIETRKLIQQIIRFLLTVGLLILVYKGKKWARILMIVLFSIAIIGGLTGIIIIESDSVLNKLPLIVMTIVYSIAIYHFGLSKSYRSFFEYQNRSDKNN